MRRPRRSRCSPRCWRSALPACGSASQPERGRRSGASARRGVALKKIGSFDEPVYVTGAPGFPKLLFVVEQPGRVVVLQRRPPARAALPRPPRPGRLRRRARPALDRLPARLPRRAGASTSITRTPRGNIRVDEFKRRSATRAAAGSRRRVIEIPHPVNSNHNGGQLQFLGNLLYFGTGDGGSGGDPPNNAQNRDVLLGKLLRIDPRPAAGSPTRCPPSNPFVGRARPRRDLQLRPAQPVPLLLRHGHRASSRGSRSATSARTSSRSSTTRPSRAAAGANFGWDAFEGFAPYDDENSGTPDPGGTVKPIFAYPHSRGGSCSIIGGYVVARPRPALPLQALRLRRLLRGRAAQPRPPPEAGRRRPQARPLGRQPQLLRRRRPAAASTSPRSKGRSSALSGAESRPSGVKVSKLACPRKFFLTSRDASP